MCRVALILPYLLLTALALGGCASPLEDAAERAPRELPGLTAAQLRLCAGEPAARNREGGNELWSYFRETRSSATADSGIGATPTDRANTTYDYYRYCEAVFTLRDGRVTALSLKGRTSTGRETLQPCGAIVDSCLRLKAH